MENDEIVSELSGSVPCPKCEEPIHPERIAAGYHTCVKCSTTERYGYIHVFEGKTGDRIEIVKDAKLAEKIRKTQGGKHGQI